MALKAVGFVCALASEARFLGPVARGVDPIQKLANGALVRVCGIGHTAATAGARALIDAGATALASWGMAGGLDPALAPGALCLPTEIMGLDGPLIHTSAPWRDRLAAELTGLLAPGSVTQGRLLSSRQVITTADEKADLFRSTHAVAVDMESLAVGEIAAARGLPFMVVRAIVDSARDVIPRAVLAAANATGQVSAVRLLRAVVVAPSNLQAIIRLATCYRAAGRSLSAIATLDALAP